MQRGTLGQIRGSGVNPAKLGLSHQSAWKSSFFSRCSYHACAWINPFPANLAYLCSDSMSCCFKPSSRTPQTTSHHIHLALPPPHTHTHIHTPRTLRCPLPSSPSSGSAILSLKRIPPGSRLSDVSMMSLPRPASLQVPRPPSGQGGEAKPPEPSCLFFGEILYGSARLSGTSCRDSCAETSSRLRAFDIRCPMPSKHVGQACGKQKCGAGTVSIPMEACMVVCQGNLTYMGK